MKIDNGTYNSSPNAWNKIGMEMYFVFGEWLMLSRNIPVSSVYSHFKNVPTFMDIMILGILNQ